MLHIDACASSSRDSLAPPTTNVGESGDLGIKSVNKTADDPAAGNIKLGWPWMTSDDIGRQCERIPSSKEKYILSELQIIKDTAIDHILHTDSTCMAFNPYLLAWT